MIPFSFSERAETFTCVYEDDNLVKGLKLWKQMGYFNWEIKGIKKQNSRATIQMF